MDICRGSITDIALMMCTLDNFWYLNWPTKKTCCFWKKLAQCLFFVCFLADCISCTLEFSSSLFIALIFIDLFWFNAFLKIIWIANTDELHLKMECFLMLTTAVNKLYVMLQVIQGFKFYQNSSAILRYITFIIYTMRIK